MVVQRSHDADFMQPFGIAMVVLNGVCIGSQHVGIFDDVSGGVGTSLQQVVLIAVHACYHILAYLLPELGLQYGFLSFGQ